MKPKWAPLRKAPVGIESGLPALRFELELDGCCVLCNPVALADYETRCVRVVGTVTVTICEDCVSYMATVLQVRARRKKAARKKAAH